MFWDCLANAVENHRFASLISGSDHLLKYVTYVRCHNKCARKLFDVRDDIPEKNTIFDSFHMFSYKSLASDALILGILVIATNKPMDLCYRCYIYSFYHILPNAYNTKIYRYTNRK